MRIYNITAKKIGKIIMATDTLKKIFLTLFIISVLGLQAMTSITKFIFTSWHFQKGAWPIISYPMYHKPRQEGEHLDIAYKISAELNNGEVIEVTNDDLGLKFWDFQRVCWGLIAAKKDGYLKVINSHPRGSEMIRLQVYNSPYIVTKEGLMEANAEVVYSKDLTASNKEVK